MKVERVRLLISIVLLVGWLSWLGYLAATKTNPVVVSRSQAMASTHFVLANVTVDKESGQPAASVTVVSDLRPLNEPLNGEVKIRNLKEARVANEAETSRFQGEGPYLLMLTRLPDGTFELTPPPRAPGAETAFRPRPWAYRWNAPGVQQQFDEIVPQR